MKWSIATFAGKVVGYFVIAVLCLAWSRLAFGQDWLMISSYGSPSFRTTFITGSSVNGFLTTNRLGSMTITNVNLNFRSSILEPPISVTGALSTHRLGAWTWTDVDLRFRPTFSGHSLSLTGTLSTYRLGTTTFIDANFRLRPSTFGVTSNPSRLTITGSSHSWSW